MAFAVEQKLVVLHLIASLLVLSCVHETISDLTRFSADKPRHAFQVSHVHIRIHSIQPCFQTGNRLIGRREKPYLFINMPDKPIRPLMLALHIKAAAECPAGSQDPKNLPISGLLVRKA